jgi:DNA-3-methyladenine glycosylase II
MKAGLTEAFGSALDFEGTTYEAFPEAGALAMRSPDDINVVVGNLWKSEGLRSVAYAFDNVDDQWLRTTPDHEVERWLRSIKGIGDWSATFIMLRGLGRMRVLPLGDKVLLEAASRVYRQMATPEELLRLAQPYGDNAGYWAHYLRAAT